MHFKILRNKMKIVQPGNKPDKNGSIRMIVVRFTIENKLRSYKHGHLSGLNKNTMSNCIVKTANA